MRLLRRITLAMSAAPSSPANTAVSLEPRHFRTLSRSGSNLSQQNCEGGYGSRVRYLKKRCLIWLCKQFRNSLSRLLRNSLIGRRPSLVPLPSWRQTLEPSDEKWADQVFRMPLARSRWRRERISIWTSEQRQGLGDEVIVANVRELRAISHSDRKKDQVEVDGMDEEQATKEALETDQSERRQGGLDGCDGD